MENEIYREALIDLFENAKNRGEMANPDLKSHVVNQLCGDEVSLYLKLKGDKVESAMFSGDGCLLSQVSTSLLTSHIESLQL